MIYNSQSKNNYLCKSVFVIVNAILINGGAVIWHNVVLLSWAHKYKNLCQKKSTAL